ncbi:MAG: flagellar assembly protein FliW [candidate division KSB1 bacterium]|nr:flagellar assembly protein FliW [candidate division KSB1 bacterium]MDZ7393407.1 flagellar assembly protein FliW [candidate division KSB1 bacterium]
MMTGQTMNTAVLGEIELDEEAVLTFPEGLPGFEHYTRFVILGDERFFPFQWLQSVEDANLAFPIIEPHFVCRDYCPRLSKKVMESLQLESPEEAQLFAITTIGSSPREVTANLKAPLVVNPKARLAKQYILEGTSYSLRHPVLG